MQKVFVTGGSGFVGRALIGELARTGIGVHALARSEAAMKSVTERGATAVRGDLDELDAMTEGMRGCDLVVHAAAYVQDTGPRDMYFRVNVQGTENVLAAARKAGVPRFVHVGTEAVLADGKPIVRATEEAPYPAKPAGLYPLTKGIAERTVRAANGAALETMVVRPRFIWGRGDTSLLPKLTDAVRTGKWRWIDHGDYLTSTCHVDNVVEGILCAAERGQPGEIYFLTDGEPVKFRTFITDMLRTTGVQPGDKSIPRFVARTAARALSFMNEPPITWTAIALISHEVTVDDSKARREIGYESRTTIAEGLAQMQTAAAAPPSPGGE